MDIAELHNVPPDRQSSQNQYQQSHRFDGRFRKNNLDTYLSELAYDRTGRNRVVQKNQAGKDICQTAPKQALAEDKHCFVREFTADGSCKPAANEGYRNP
ncbi:hypothetical protein D3C81_1010270 [compost metagenome]